MDKAKMIISKSRPVICIEVDPEKMPDAVWVNGKWFEPVREYHSIRNDLLGRYASKKKSEASIFSARISQLEADNKRLREVLGAHLQADGCASEFPDNVEDEKHLKRQETHWRLIARSWLDDLDLYLECCEAAKQRAASTEGGE